MKRIQNAPLQLFFLLLLLFSFTAMACQLGSALEATPTPRAREEEPEAEPEPTEEPPTVAAPTPEPEEPEVEEPIVPEEVIAPIERLQAATVQIFAKQVTNGRLQTIWTGSGTILSPDGVILTNAHVAAPSAPGLATLYNDPELLFGEEPDQLVVALSDSADRPPTERYIAELAAADGSLDLAVIKITADLDGNPLDTGTLNLPFVEIGDANSIRLGDEIRILGYPGAGGETITFTRGNVAGFESQPRVGDRAWIKTDATISPGNSGGLGVNAAGQIIGVPSFGQEAIGGAINRMRSINYALPLLEAAAASSSYKSPYVVTGTGQETFNHLTWADDYRDEDGCAIGPRSSYPSNTTFAVAIFEYSGLADGEQVLVAWWLEDELMSTVVFEWNEGVSGDCTPFYFHNYGDPIPNGNYAVEIYAGGDLEFVGMAETAVGSSTATNSNTTTPTDSGSKDGVRVEGEILDADSGKPLSGAVIFILQPGTDLDAWLENPTDADVYTYAETDQKGYFFLPQPLQRGVEYPGVAGLTGYYNTDGFLSFTAEDPDSIYLTLELSK
ncbi:MAG: trypsin-like peptidase domain-containing protein [Ardenticatenaceae bacterium]|nr:trypsin-like peptidase domain-containing protein [Anaerolineales bacterium]MCB8941126.1 trypsin-like peptidase domain-containing protein [Ardenticatenaceae bacterium]MCB8972467.1 trypsin-like peptidase domain-containing protein [Ardenticatenaceae bacterium]